MALFIKTCESSYGNRTEIYHYVNVNQIIEIHVEKTQSEMNVEATLTNGMRVIIMYYEDLEKLGKEVANKIKKEFDNED